MRLLWGCGGFSLFSRDQSPACAEQDTIGLLTDNSSNMPDFDSRVHLDVQNITSVSLTLNY